MKKAYEMLARIYWKVNRVKFIFMINKELKYWERKINNVLDASKDSYLIDLEALGIELMENEKQFKVLGEIDEQGRLLSKYKISGRPQVSKNDFVKRRKNDIYLVSVGGKVGIKKKYRGNKEGFLKELRGLYLANLGGVNAPKILDVDFNELFIIFSYIDGCVLRDLNELADKRTMYKKTLNQINKAHNQGVFVNDISSKNIIINPYKQPFIIDFEMSAYKSELGIFFKHFIEKDKKSLYNLLGK